MKNCYAHGCNREAGDNDDKPKPHVCDIARQTQQNENYRTELWTGCRLQMTLMCIPVCGDVGLEVHPDTDQIIRVEAGQALVCMGECKEKLNFQRRLCMGDAVFVPGGTWHNVINAGNCPLKLSSVYAPPKHPGNTAHRTKADAEKEEY